MKNAVYEYLAARDHASSLDIARDVLKLQNVNAATAEQVVTALLADFNKVVQLNGVWSIAEQSGKHDDEQYTICTILPERSNSYRDWNSLRLQSYSGNTMTGSLVLFEEKGAATLSISELTDAVKSVRDFSSANLVFSGFGNQISVFQRAMQTLTGNGFEGVIISIRRLAGRLYSNIKKLEDICRELGIVYYQDAGPEQQMDLLVTLFMHLRKACEHQGKLSIQELAEYQFSEKFSIDFGDYGFDKDFLVNLPELAGVYIMRNRQGNVIYVGKSRNLYNRVNSYFNDTITLDEKHAGIRQNVYTISIEHTGSEPEALLKEQEYISTYQPPYNTQMQVHAREHLADIDEQIVFLPGDDPLRQRVLCVRTGRVFAFYDLYYLKPNAETIYEIDQFFRNKKLEANENFPLISTWLSANRHLNCIQYKNVVSLKELERLIQDYLNSMSKSKERIIHV